MKDLSRPSKNNRYAWQCTAGATLLSDNRTQFCFWAPSATAVDVVLDGGMIVPMQALDGGWFSAEAACGVGTRYRYRIGDLLVPDPASRAQAGDVHEASIVIDPHTYEWRHTEWSGRPWHESVIYEVHVGTLGGFKGVADILPKLAALGVTAIELMPLSEFPGGRNWGYDGVLPYAVESSYGTPEDLKAMIDTAHEHGLMVFLDVVYNHFGPDGNYLHAYAEKFFREDIHTPWGAAIDFRQQAVRSYFKDNALMWLMEYRFDGLRFDAVHAIGDKGFLMEMADEIRSTVEPGRHVHLVLENEDNTASLLGGVHYDGQWADDWHNVIHPMITGENEGYYQDFTQDATAKLVRCLSEGFIYQGEDTRHGKGRGEPSSHLQPTAFVIFLQNHDQIGNRALGERLTLLAPENALKAATTLLLLSPMIPLLFIGEEWGSRQPFLFFTSHNEELAKLVRDGRRNEFKDFEFFTHEENREKIPDPNAVTTFEDSKPNFGEADQPDHALWVGLYKKLLEIRHQEIIPRLPGARPAEAKALGEKAVTACWTLGDGARLTLEINLSEQAVSVDAKQPGRLLFASMDNGLSTREQGQLAGHTALAWLEDAQ
ncbi:malto-oligosyltrehalose trehalohydrolase [Pseudomonas luteola]|uniref:Malto-oligosyltrehalose trehalohydrolase n=1 Tax=Pseudomonas luteola TaxID=47886 RepID=A0ABS0MNQ8_PSELU|nr:MULTISPECIES: malto-oligosyltrehalose trehalohydrolase [Pseudomonas]MBH3437524.1 malto-oligosyltrehalose trehalohydrolase [Pseudomonas luteola]